MRPDLFFRLAGYAIRAPALNERIGDVPELCQHFLTEFAKRHQVGSISLAPEALDALCAHSWPGNVRELRAVVENASIVARSGEIQRHDVDSALQSRASAAVEFPESWEGPVATNQRQIIEEASANFDRESGVSVTAPPAPEPQRKRAS